MGVNRITALHKKIIVSIFAITVSLMAMASSTITAEASTSEVLYAQSFITAHKEIYGEKYAPMQKLSSGEINLSTGEVSINEADFSLPGKGGLDLNIHRIYSSQEPNHYIRYRESDYSSKVYAYPAYVYTIMDGSNQKINISFEKEEDMVDTIHTTYNRISEIWNEDAYGVAYLPYSYLAAQTGTLRLERDKTLSAKEIYRKSTTEIYGMSISTANIFLPTGNKEWKLAMPYVTLTNYIQENTRRIFYMKFGNEKGEVYDIRFYIEGTSDDEIWYPEGEVRLYGKEYSAELILDESNLNYILTLKDKESIKYRFDLGNIRNTSPYNIIATSISDRFGNQITYNGNEITDTYGRKVRVSENGIEIYNGNSYKYVVKYDVDKIIDEDRDPYDKLTIFTKYQLAVSRNVSELNGLQDVFVETKYITQAKETDCSFTNYEHIPVYVLKEVTHPEGLKIEYTYEETCTEKKIPVGYADDEMPNYLVPKVTSRKEYIKTPSGYNLKNESVYSYSTTNNFPTYIFEAKTRAIEEVKADGATLKTITRLYDAFGRILSEKESGNPKNTEKEYWYKQDSSTALLKNISAEDYPSHRQVPVNVTHTTVNGVLIEDVLTEYTTNRKPTVIQRGLQKQTYTYDDTYNFVTESIQTTDFDRQLKTVGTKTADGKNIAKSETFEVIGETETLQGVTEYTYNQDGTVASETVKLNSNGDTVRTDYSYDYSLFESPQNGKHSVTATITTTDASGNTRTESNTVEYDLLGNVIKEIDAGGNETEYKYDLMRRVTEEVYADGTKRSIAYDTVDRTVTVTEPNGKKVTNEYDPSGNHIKTYMPDENNATLVSNAYDSLDRKIESVMYSDSQKNIKETYKYDSLNRITEQTTGDEKVTYSISEIPHTVDVVNSSGYISRTIQLNGEYEAALVTAQPTTVANANLEISADGNRICNLRAYFDNVIYEVIDLSGKNTLLLEGRISGYVYISAVKLQDIGTGSLGARTIVTSTSTGDESFTAPKTVTTYDGAGKVISEEKRDNTTDAVLTRDEYSYDFLGNVTEYRDSRVNLDEVGEYTSRIEYNWQGLPVKETNAVGDSKLYTYDLLGRLLETQDETGAKTTFVYDELGREIVTEKEITDAETTRTEKYYDLSGNVVKERIKNNKAGESATYSEVHYEYDSMHRPTAIKTNDGTRNIYTQYAYDSMGNVTKVVTGQTQKVDLNGEIPQTANVTEYQYDRFGNVTKTTDANGLFEMAEYNFVGLPTSSTDKKGITTAYTYNKYGSPLSVATAGVDAISYTYNVNNMPISVTQGTNSTIYEYDALGRLTKETENGIVKTYQLDKVGNRTASNVGGIETAYTYDALNRLTGVTFEGGSAGYTYDKMGRLTGETKGGIETSYTYNKAGWMTNKTNTKNDVATTYVLAYSNDGNIVSRTENGEVTNYTYDGLGQLVAEDDTLYEYDTRGNRTKMTKDGVVTEYRYDRTNKLMTENTNGVWTAYAYDKNGNNTLREVYEITADGTQTELDYLILSYDPLNRLTKVQKDGMTAEYTYGTNNMRLTKTVNGETQKFIWDGGNIVGITDAQGTVTDKYYRGVGLVASYTDTLNYYQTNDHGDVSAWGDISYSYDAFGNQETQKNDENPFRFCGEYADAESGLIYLRARMYDPSTGRFINEDPIKDGLNWYVYCENNPVMFVDPWGLEGVIAISWSVQGQYVIGAGYGKGIAIDSNFNTAEITNTSLVVGTPGLGASINISVYPEMKSLSELEASGIDCGVDISASFNNYSASVALDDDGISGVTIGVGTPASGIGFSMSVTRTDVEIIDYDSSAIVLFLNGNLSNEMKYYINKNIFKDYILIPDSTADTYDDYMDDYIKSGYADLWTKDGGFIE